MKALDGRVGAINLEQLDTLLLSLKTYWNGTNLPTQINSSNYQTIERSSARHMSLYEL